MNFRLRISQGILRAGRRTLPTTVSLAQRRSISDLNPEGLANWAQNPPSHSLVDSLSAEHLRDLYITLPTRDGSQGRFEMPSNGQILPYGHHLAFFHARKAEKDLREDGTEADLSPPPPFSTRMWVGGTMAWNDEIPLRVGVNTTASSIIGKVEKKGFDNGRPLVFATQFIKYVQAGQTKASVEETRTHVYLHAELSAKLPKVFDRPVKDISTDIDFSLKFTPTAVTLFRYSALMFNAHHTHLDKEYCQKVEGYPERLVHGPLTAQMLLETVNHIFPGMKFTKFEYRATNPLFVYQELTFNGTWKDESTIEVWCQSDGVVGMTGKLFVLP